MSGEEEELRGLIESYTPFARKLSIDEHELREALLQIARAAVRHENRCLNCSLSRADRQKNQEAAGSRGMMLLQARVCVLGLSSRTCGSIRKCIVPEDD